MVTYIFTLPVLQKAAQNGDQVGAFIYGDYGADFYSNGIGAMEDYIKEKPDVTRDFVQATMKGSNLRSRTRKKPLPCSRSTKPQLDTDVALQEVEILRDITNSKNPKVLGSMTTDKMKETAGSDDQIHGSAESRGSERYVHQRIPD